MTEVDKDKLGFLVGMMSSASFAVVAVAMAFHRISHREAYWMVGFSFVLTLASFVVRKKRLA